MSSAYIKSILLGVLEIVTGSIDYDLLLPLVKFYFLRSMFFK